MQQNPPIEMARVTYEGESDQPYCLAWSPDGKYLAFGDNVLPAPTVQVWRVEKAGAALVATYTGHRDEVFGGVNTVAWSPDGTRIASASHDGSVEVWEAETGRRLLTYRGHVQEGTWVLKAAWSPDGRCIASCEGGLAEKDYAVQVWEAETGRHLLTYGGHHAAIYALAWSPDGTRIASGSYDSTLQIWERISGACLACHRHPGWVHAVAWSPDGVRIAAALDDYMVQIWSASTHQPLLTRPAHDGKTSHFPFAYTADLAWSPDGHYLLTGSSDGVMQICDADSGELSLSIAVDESEPDRAHACGIVAVAWSSKWEKIALIVLDGTVRAWLVEAPPAIA